MSDEQEQASREMPRYKCHKEVWALKIKDVILQPAGGHLIVPEDEGYAAFHVSDEYRAMHKPQPGGYYVVYDDGYKSYSPAAAFDSGYMRVEKSALELGAAARAAGPEESY